MVAERGNEDTERILVNEQLIGGLKSESERTFQSNRLVKRA